MSTLGVLGFGLSIVALIWTFALTWVRTPRIAVEIHPARDVAVVVGGGNVIAGVVSASCCKIGALIP